MGNIIVILLSQAMKDISFAYCSLLLRKTLLFPARRARLDLFYVSIYTSSHRLSGAWGITSVVMLVGE